MNTCALRPPSVVLNRVSRQYTFEKKGLEVSPPRPHPPSHSTAATSRGPATLFILARQQSVNMASTAGVKYVSIFLHPPCFQGFFYIRIHRQILFSASSSKERHCRSGKKNPNNYRTVK